MPEEKVVNKEAPQASAESVDENGVPWKNRAKELERKFSELESKIDSLKPVVQEQPKSAAETLNDKQQKVLEFMEVGPDKYVERKLQEAEWNRQIVEVRELLTTDSSLTTEDKERLKSIEEEFQLSGMPMQRARAALKILGSEKNQKTNADSERAQKTNQQRTEGAGKNVPITNATRESILEEIKKVERKEGIFSPKSLELLSRLEDVR